MSIKNNASPMGQVGDHEIKQLKIFKAVVDCKGFSAAETLLNISRPAISIHIANLEERLNVKLCKRGRSGFSLTEEGAIVYSHAKKLIEHLDDFKSAVNNISLSPSGKLKVALSDALSLDPKCQLPEIIKDFCNKAPNVELFFYVEQMQDIERQVLNGDTDIGFIPYHRQLDGLNYFHLFTDRHNLYCGKDHHLYPLSDQELTPELINDAPLSHAGLKPHEDISKKIANMNLAGVSYFYESRIAMALSGKYLCFLPESIAKDHESRGDLKIIMPEHYFYLLDVAVISKKTIQSNKAKELFFDSIEQLFGNDSRPSSEQDLSEY